MPQTVIENPIINSPFREPTRHYYFGKDGITNEIVESRRISTYFSPVPRPKGRKQQLQLDTEWVEERIEENRTINEIREKVAIWRKGGYVGVTSTTRRLLDYWQREERERRLFFCQIEALETAIYLTEVANKYGDAWIENRLREANREANPELYRVAFKMATGSGKTLVMAMLIAWQTLNKLANAQAREFNDAFLIVTPGITIRDRLRVLLPSDPNNYYRAHDLVPPELLPELHKAKLIVTNYHTFKLRETVSTGKLTKTILATGEQSPFTETPDQMVRRVCRELGTKRNIIVINDEAHHCYRRKPDGERERLTTDERQEVRKRDEEARIWISGLEAVKAKLGIRALYDLSATPFFLKGSGYPEGKLFPWVVSDFSLVDAIESGIVKVPRVPIADDAMQSDGPTYRNLWPHIRDELPKKGYGTQPVGGEPQLPKLLESALHSLYGNYQKQHQLWRDGKGGLTPPVFIIVCNNTNVSKLVFDYVAGWQKQPGVLVPGALPIFSNVDGDRWSPRANTILVDSEQLESGDAMSADFKKLAATEIDEFKAEYRARFPGRDADEITDEDLLREVLNTVGKPGKLGEHVKCVVSVSMLTEGWDANTVTHILGVRAFGTQLLCEQVVGRGLRRMSYVANEQGMFEPEYAEVYGVPFSFIPTTGSTTEVKTGPVPTRVRALEERAASEITFPRLIGYRYDLAEERLTARFTADSQLALSTSEVPSMSESAAIIGESSIHTLDSLKERRPQEVEFLLAKLVIEKYFRQDGEQRTDRPAEHRFDAEVQAWRFPQVLRITRQWLAECVTLKDNAFIQMLLLIEWAHDAADRIHLAIIRGATGERVIKPILRPYDTVGSTRYVDFDTTKPVYQTDPEKCQITYVVADTGRWEQKLAQTLEEMDEVVAYAKNQNLGFSIPYTYSGIERQYVPDFIARVNDGHGDDLLNLIIEVSGEGRADKAAKVAAARNLWIPAVNNHGGFGRWVFVEVTDPWNAQHTIRGILNQHAVPATQEAA